ncbi:MAG: CCA tRNA nucleotidyltransferase [Deltaproteobacteria bacterium]|nr:CCA tRNA nucleotidyltransferase [Deltaproteobacteria bacterium]
MNRGDGESSNGTGRLKSARSFFKRVREIDSLKEDLVLKKIHAILKGPPVYLVGGAVRNSLLSKPITPDYDFAAEGDIKALSAMAAKGLGGTSFVLDEETSTYRVAVKKKGRAAAYAVDIAPVKNGDIICDLRMRDFTVNAMAVRLKDLFEAFEPLLLDPAGGVEDVERRALRCVSTGVFDDDPLRCLRAFRLSQQYGLEVDEETLNLIKEKSVLLASISAERIRDEIISIFSSQAASKTIERLYSAGVVKIILPEASGWADVEGYNLLGHSLKTLDEAEKLLASIYSGGFPGAGMLKRHFEAPIGPVKKKSLFKAAAFFHDTGKPLTISREEGRLRFIGHDFEGSRLVMEILRRLKFSNRFAGEVSNLVKNHHRVFMLAQLKDRTPRARGHFFRASGGSSGVDLLCLSLADARATRGGEDEELYRLVIEMLDFYFGVYTRKKQRPILNGKEIMDIFKVPEGPVVGEIISKISEGVERGAVRNKREALEYVKAWLKADRGRG